MSCVVVLLAGLLAGAARCTAQEDELLIDGLPLENAVVGRALAVRLRAEAWFTEDDDDLIEDDIGYARFPSRMYNLDARLHQQDRFTTGVTYSRWQNDQDLDYDSITWDVRIPFARPRPGVPTEVVEGRSPPFLSLKYKRREADESNRIDERDYIYAGVGHYPAAHVYSFPQYRVTSEEGEVSSHQFSEYLSWTASTRLRLGTQGSVTTDEGQGGLGPWYVRLFGTYFLVEDYTALRMDARHYDDSDGLTYQETNAYLYQQLGTRSLVRLNYRYYRDSDELASHAAGVKVKHFFTPRFTAHVGYRYYDHSAGADFDSFFGGLGLLL